MAAPYPLPEPLVPLIAERFRALGEPMRIRLLDALREGEATVGELAERLATSQQNVSKHVGVLVANGMVEREKQGTAVRCRIADSSVFDLCEVVCDGLARRVAEVQDALAPQAAAR